MTLHTDISTRWLLVYIDEPKFMQRELILKNPLSPKPTCWYELHIAENLTFIALLLLPCALPYLVASCLSLFSYFFQQKATFSHRNMTNSVSQNISTFNTLACMMRSAKRLLFRSC